MTGSERISRLEAADALRATVLVEDLAWLINIANAAIAYNNDRTPRGLVRLQTRLDDLEAR